MFDNLVVVISLVSGIATIISFLINKAGFGNRFVHSAYVLVVTALSAVLALTAQEAKLEREYLKAHIELISSIEYEAAEVLNNTPRRTDGQQRGFIFAALSFLERHKDEVPDSYERATQFALASGVIENRQEDGMQRLYQSWRLSDASSAMESLLKGLSAGRENKD